jgi:hypothetical protein
LYGQIYFPNPLKKRKLGEKEEEERSSSKNEEFTS